jgi:peroxiredoxin (alkyl hydroperoxide reductase subunit C)
MPLLGERFPEMTVQTTQGTMQLPEAYAGKWFVLFSHPGDFTPVCTTEFVAFANRQEQFRENDTELIGLSVDQVQPHMKWIEWINSTLKTNVIFPIIADGTGLAARQLCMIHPAKGTSTVRAVFIVDPKGVIRTIFYYPQEVGRNIDEIQRTVRALQISDENKVAMPANWPNNELIGDNVILPSPKDEATKATRATNDSITCFDWWLCYKQLKY